MTALSTSWRSTVEVTSSHVTLRGERVAIRDTPGVAGRTFGAAGEANIRMITQGASRLNLTFVVAEQDLAQVVGRLHAEFFRNLDPAVFD